MTSQRLSSAEGSTIPGRRPDKKNKIIVLHKEGETGLVIMANKVHRDVAFVNHARNDLLQESLRSQKAGGPLSPAIPLLVPS